MNWSPQDVIVPLEKEPEQRLTPLSLADLLDYQFPSRVNLLAPWLPSQGLVMAYAPRGIGKTHFALGVAYAVASAGEFLGWHAPQAAGVLYLDGEMPGAVMQERLATIVANADREPIAPFVIVNPDLQPNGMPRIDSAAGQTAIDELLTDDIKLIVVDNISTLSSGRENEADSWGPMQTWALHQRAQGRTVLFIHHAGKGGSQRGTSRREDVLDTVIALRRPAEYTPEQGATFEVHFEKSRGIYGDDVRPFEASLTTTPDGRMSWTTRSLEDSTLERVVALLNDGLSQKEVSIELGINKSNVSRHAKTAKELGLLKGGGGMTTNPPELRDELRPATSCAVAPPTQRNCATEGPDCATTDATTTQPTPLKAKADAVLQRNRLRNQPATSEKQSATFAQLEAQPGQVIHRNGGEVAQLRFTRERNCATETEGGDPVAALVDSLPLLREDAAFMRRCLMAMQLYGTATADELCEGYAHYWLDAAEREPVPHKKDNRGRHAANSWLRRQVETRRTTD